jgi:predicted DCC family thiol-disulfide oxidoreductase YuxK
MVSPPAHPPAPAARGWIGYDAECAFCQGWVRRWGPRLTPRGFVFTPLEEAFWRTRLALPPGGIPEEVKLLLADGRLLGGAEAILFLARTIWWLAPLAWAMRLPGLFALTSAIYRRIARHRHRLSSH